MYIPMAAINKVPNLPNGFMEFTIDSSLKTN